MSRLHPVASVLALAFALAASGACASAGAGKTAGGSGRGEVEDPNIGEPVPDLPLASLGGKRPLRLSSLQGKVVLLDIWASWCAPCKEELPLLDDMAARLKSRGIEIVAVSIDEDKRAAQDFLKSRPKWALTFVHDPSGKLPGRLQPPKMPTSYVIDTEGIIQAVNAGFERGDLERIEARLIKLAQ